MQGVRVDRGAELLEAPLEFTPVARIDLRQRQSGPNVFQRPSRLDERLQSALLTGGDHDVVGAVVSQERAEGGLLVAASD